MTTDQILLYGIILLILIIFIFRWIDDILKDKKLSVSPYFELKKRITTELSHAKFSNDWIKFQKYNLQNLWLEVLRDYYKVTTYSSSGENLNKSLSNLDEKNLKLPSEFLVNSKVHLMYADRIVKGFGSTLADFPNQSVDRILPFPKIEINRAFDLLIEYAKSDSYKNSDKDEYLRLLNSSEAFLSFFEDDSRNAG